jgi:hypothetical protein
LELFGKTFFEFCQDSGYDKILQVLGATPRDFLQVRIMNKDYSNSNISYNEKHKSPAGRSQFFVLIHYKWVSKPFSFLTRPSKAFKTVLLELHCIGVANYWDWRKWYWFKKLHSSEMLYSKMIVKMIE